MERYTALFATEVANGASLEEALALLRSQGATPVDAIKAIYTVQGVSLGEAKQLFTRSPAWAREVQAGDALHEEITALLSKEQKP